MKYFILLIIILVSLSCSSSKESTNSPTFASLVKSVRNQNKELCNVIGIDTLSLSIIKKYYQIGTKEDTINLNHDYEISFLTENFESLNKITKENILSFLFENNFSIHFLGNNFSSNKFYNGIGMMIFSISINNSNANYILNLYLMKSSRGGEGYECNLENVGGKFIIEDVELRYVL